MVCLYGRMCFGSEAVLWAVRVVPNAMSNFFLHANREQQTKQSMVVDGTRYCVILECLVTSIACITWPVSLLTKWPTICRFASVLSSNFSLKRKSLLQKFTRIQRAYGSVCMGASSVRRWVKRFKDGKHEHPRSASEGSPSNSLNWTQQGESGWGHSRRQACDCGNNSPNTWSRALCSTGDDWKLRL